MSYFYDLIKILTDNIFTLQIWGKIIVTTITQV